jgi:hypothetical protein
MDHHVAVAGEPDFQNPIRHFAAKAGEGQRSIAHVYVYPTY